LTEIAGLGARPWVGAPEYRPGWRRQIQHAGGGALVDVGVHAFYLTAAFLGAPVSAVAASVGFDDTGLDDLALCRLETSRGQGIVNVAWRQGGAKVVVMGTRGYAEVIFDEGVGYYGYPARGVRVFAEGRPTTTHYAPYFTGMFAPQLFTDLARLFDGDAKAYPARGEDARAALEVAMAAYESAAKRATVDLPLDKGSALYREGLAALRPRTMSGGVR
jgi:predicted dehydrogenase